MDSELIEEAAKAIQEVRWVAVRNSDGSVSSHEADSETLARAALAVFEKAHAPTDEREALADLVLNSTAPYKVTDAWAAADAILAAGFRRPVSPAPSACDHDWHNRVSGGSLCSKCNLWQDKRVRELPADPSDAQVLAGLNASERSSFVRRGVPRAFGAAPDLSYYSVENAADMRAALRAAFAVTEQGENRGEQNR